MSDYQHDHMNPATDNEQKTRVLAPVGGTSGQETVTPAATAPAAPRHRRSDRYREEGPAAAAETQAMPVRPMATGENAAFPRTQARYTPGERPAPMGTAPRPAALARAQEQNGQAPFTPGNSGVRRPVQAPGYSQRQPLGAGPRVPGQAGESFQARRPAEMDDSLGYDYYENEEEQRPRRRGHGLLVTLVVIVLVLGLATLGFLLIPNDDSTLGQLKGNVTRQLEGLLGDAGNLLGAKETAAPAEALDFSAAPVRGEAATVGDVVFSLTTTKSVEGVRVVDEDGNALVSTRNATIDNTDSRIWTLNLNVENGYEGQVQAQVLAGEIWLDTGKTQQLEITPPQMPALEAAAVVTETPAPTATAVPTEVPTAVPTEVPTEVPTAAPTEAPTQTPVLTPTLAPTATPTMIPTQAPTEVPTPTPEPTPEPTPAPTEAPAMDVQAVEQADPALITAAQVYNGSEKISAYDRPVEDVIKMPAAGYYTTLPFGVMTYRGDSFRQNAVVGNVGDISKMTLAWTAEAGSVKGANSTYYGIGWTGQPAIIKWSKEVRNATNINEEKQNVTALKEVIIAGMDGNIYFLDLKDGQPTRDPIKLGYPMRGTPSLHPLGYPVMAVGQYARKMANGTGDIGLRMYNLLSQEKMYMIDGLDGKMKRPYNAVGAFDTSALIDPKTDTMITAGTNGLVYLTKLHTEFDNNTKTIKMNPTTVVMRSKVKGQKDAGTAVESSVAMYANYLYYADMKGILRCVDTTSLTTMWAVDTGDAVEAAIALDFDEDGRLWLYTANTLQNRAKGDGQIRRFDAMTGEESWTYSINLLKNKEKKVSGAMASPVIGQNDLSDLVYFTLSNISKAGTKEIYEEATAGMDGLLLALDKATGRIVWSKELDGYSYSSPVAVYSEAGEGWIIQASSTGTLYLLDGLTGAEISTLKVEGTIDASPAVYGDTLVIGTTGKNTSFIYGITLE